MRILLVPNLGNADAVRAACTLAEWLSDRRLEPVMTPDDARGCGLDRHAVAATDIGIPALTVALGGDGTILKAVHTLGEAEAPILGVNLGRLGFMSGALSEKMADAVEAALAGEGRLERRTTLEASVAMGGRVVGTYRALNEVFVGRGASGRVIETTLLVNGLDIARFRSDGVVVATPTGSTAYALSAGGPIVSPDVACAVVVPVAPHTLASRAVVVGPADDVEIRLSNPARRDACVVVDGELTPCRRDVESIQVRRGEHDVLLVKLEGRDFYEVVRAEFFGV